MASRGSQQLSDTVVDLPRQRPPNTRTRCCCCCTISLRTATLIIATLETLHWFYEFILFLFSIINHGRWWSIAITGVVLLITLLAILCLIYGVNAGNPLCVQLHLMYLIVSIIWLLVLIFGCVALSVFPYPKVNTYFGYDGAEVDARIFASVMFLVLVGLVICKIFMSVVIYRYWLLMRYRMQLHSYV